MKSILIEFACNDPGNGNDTGRVGKIQLVIGGECAAELDCWFWPPSRFPRFSAALAPDRWVRISQRTFRILGYSNWVGNWCWDAASVTPVVAADILNYLRELGWHNEGGFGDICGQWDRGEKFKASDIEALAMTDEELEERKAARSV